MSNNHFLVVGGTKGMGRTMVKVLAGKGHKVSVLARGRPATKQRIANARYWSADLSNTASLPEVMDDVVRQSGTPANVIFFQRYRGQGDQWTGEIETTVTGTKTFVELAAPRLASPGGSIVFVSSINASLITPTLPLGYHIGKACLIQMMRYYAVTLGARGIRVNSISPGTLLKEETKDFFLKNRKLMGLYKRMVPLGRLGTAEELAATAMFLCSDAASYITGQDIVVDGGLSLLWQEALVRELISNTKTRG